MAINKDDIAKINYKGKVDWYKERMLRDAQEPQPGDEQYIPKETDVDPRQLKEDYTDLKKKAGKLDTVIDELSINLKIPIDKEKQPRVSSAAAQLDPSSNGEYISYALYRDLLYQREEGIKNIDLEWAIDDVTVDKNSNSDLIYAKYIEGASSYESLGPVSPEGDVSPNTTGNKVLDTISGWNDYQALSTSIMNFVGDFLISDPGTEYIPWNFKEDVRRKLGDYDGVLGLLDTYLPAQDKGREFLELSTGLWDALTEKKESDNSFLNAIVDILNSSYAPDLICCFVAWAGGIDIKTLQALRVLLMLMSNKISIDMKALKDAIIGIINDFFKSILTSGLIGILDQILQMIVEPVREWLRTKDETWQKIFACTPIDELINSFIIAAITAVEQWFAEKMMELYKRIEIDSKFEDEKIELWQGNKKLGDFVKLLDAIIGAIGRSSLCGQASSPTGEEVRSFMDTYQVGPAWTFEFPEEEHPNIYNSFTKQITILEEVRKVGETTEPEITVHEKTITKFVNGSGEVDAEQIEVDIDKCLNRVADEDVFSVEYWMAELRAKATEGS